MHNAHALVQVAIGGKIALCHIHPAALTPPPYCLHVEKYKRKTSKIQMKNKTMKYPQITNVTCFFFSFKYVILFPKRLTDYTKLLGRFPCCIFDESQKFKILIIAPVFTVPQTLHSYASLNFWDEAVIPGSVTRFSRSDVRFPNPTRKTFMAVGEPDY